MKLQSPLNEWNGLKAENVVLCLFINHISTEVLKQNLTGLSHLKLGKYKVANIKICVINLSYCIVFAHLCYVELCKGWVKRTHNNSYIFSTLSLNKE